jgi:hypothetical protein
MVSTVPSEAITSVRSKIVIYSGLSTWPYWEKSNPYLRLPNPCWTARENVTRIIIGPRKKTA